MPSHHVLSAPVVAITRTVTVAAGRFAPGHLGELTVVVPFELVDAVLAEARAVQQRLRDLPSRVGCCAVRKLIAAARSGSGVPSRSAGTLSR